ncbi:hypothetical protein [Pseudorhodobacter wandonensis]|uniref:hypothetical protein n=1 Tax=Pseudorhodobacter wandonensis TaxID=1120568 RepID=UPI00067BD764|nr:hypothetical protein [Pseudorhodobacter wandonensis]
MRFLALAASLGIQFAPALAGPDASASYLTNTPVSMMDLGVLRLDLALQNDPGGYAEYDWDSNRIDISAPLGIVLKIFPTKDEAETECATWITNVKRLFGLNLETGEPLFAEISRAARLFKHEGYYNKNEPETLFKDLDRMFLLTCSTATADWKVTVSSPLLGKGYSVAKD